MAFSDVSCFVFDLATPPRFASCGRFCGGKGWQHRTRYMDSWEFMLGLEGTAHIHEDGHSYDLGPGCILMLQPGHLHGGTRASSTDVSFIWLHFYPVFPAPIMATTSAQVLPSDAIGAGTRVALKQFCPSGDHSRLRVLMQQLLDTSQDGPESFGSCSYLTGLVLLEYYRLLGGSGNSGGLPGRAPAWFEQLLAWVRMNLDRPLNVAGLAEHSGRNPDHVSRLFKIHVGMTAMEWLHRQKLERARELLLTTDWPLKQISAGVGMEDTRQFLRLFKHLTGTTPTRFRNEYSRSHLNDS